VQKNSKAPDPWKKKGEAQVRVGEGDSMTGGVPLGLRPNLYKTTPDTKERNKAITDGGH